METMDTLRHAREVPCGTYRYSENQRKQRDSRPRLRTEDRQEASTYLQRIRRDRHGTMYVDECDPDGDGWIDSPNSFGRNYRRPIR